MGMITYEGDTVIHGTRPDDYMRFEANLNFMKLKKIDDFVDYITFDVNKCLFTATPDKAPALENELAEMYKDRLSIYRSEEFFIEAMPLGVDKAASLDKLFTAIGVNVEDTIACGDGFNDMSMIKYAKVGVCMKNGQQVVKDVADYVTEKTNDEDGLVEVIDKFILG
jgi:Cof subfamily protein (haloacid dehalogenase superfamily)